MIQKDGNLAFKWTWNDSEFRGICSKEAYEYNISKNRAWCRKAPCRTLKGFPRGDGIEPGDVDQNIRKYIYSNKAVGLGLLYCNGERPSTAGAES